MKIYSRLNSNDLSDFKDTINDLDNVISEIGYLSEVCGNLSKSSIFKKEYDNLKKEADSSISRFLKLKEKLESAVLKNSGIDRKKWDKLIDQEINHFKNRIGGGVSFGLDKYNIEINEYSSTDNSIEVVVSGGSGYPEIGRVKDIRSLKKKIWELLDSVIAEDK